MNLAQPGLRVEIAGTTGDFHCENPQLLWLMTDDMSAELLHDWISRSSHEESWGFVRFWFIPHCWATVFRLTRSPNHVRG